MSLQPERKLAVLLHADVVSSTALVKNNETLAHQRIQDAFRRFSLTIEEHGGVALEIRGDALIAEFPRASDAVFASTHFQHENSIHNASLSDVIQPQIRIGIALGEVVVADNTVTGEGIVLAQRLEQLSDPGGICIQDAVYQTVPKRLPFEYENLGEKLLKGFDEPVRVYGVKSGSIGCEQDPDIHVQSEPLTEKASEEPSIVVMPFENLGSDPDQEFLADGLTEDIITGLSAVSGLFVIARGSSFAYKGKNVTEKILAKELGVNYVLYGSVRQSGNRCRITVQLVNATTSRGLWTQKFDREITELFAMQDDIMQGVVASVSTQILLTEGRSRERNGQTDNQLWNLVSQARSLLYDMTEESLSKALRLCEKAVSLYPDDDQANCFLATVVYHQLLLGYDDNNEHSIDRARLHIERALSINEEYEWSHMVYAWILQKYGEHEAAIEEVERGLEINPNHSVLVGGIADLLPFVGRSEEALEYGERAMLLDPQNPTIFYRFSSQARACFHCGQFAEGAEWARKAVRRRSTWAEGHVYLIACLSAMGEIDEATRANAKCLSLFPDINIESLSSSMTIPGNVPEYEQEVSEALQRAGMPAVSSV